MLALAVVCHSLYDLPAHLARNMFDTCPRCCSSVQPAVTISERQHLSVWNGYEPDRHNSPKLLPLIFDKLKLCEYTFLLWLYFVLYRSAWTRVSSLCCLSCLAVLFIFFPSISHVSPVWRNLIIFCLVHLGPVPGSYKFSSKSPPIM